jgi:hypothetical protein
MRQQLIATELADDPGWCGLRPTVLLFDVARYPAAFGFDLDHVVGVHVTVFYLHET